MESALRDLRLVTDIKVKRAKLRQITYSLPNGPC